MARSFGLVDYKVQEAEFFLLELKRHSTNRDFGAIQFCSSAFASAARSITFAMQSCLKGNPAFDAWYSFQQEQLKSNDLAKFFNDFRRVTQHIGESVVNAGFHGKDGTLYYFRPCPDLKIVPEEDVISACEKYYKLILSIVYECYVEFGHIVNGQQYFTKENFNYLGKTIEDAEEELGFPRGWTDINSSSPDTEKQRWQTLRRQADGCLIEGQFSKWLNKKIPKPE